MGTTNYKNGVSFSTDTDIERITGTSVPTAGTSGYAPGCEFMLRDCSLGQCPKWVNFGTATSCSFYPVGPTLGYGFVAGGQVASAGGDTTETIALQGIAMDSDYAIVGHDTTDDTDTIAAAIADEGKITITASADPSTAHGYAYGLLRNKCYPMFDIVAAGTATTAGGSTAEAITVSGVLATDIGFACYSATDDTDTIAKVVCTANTVTVTCSADPSTTHGLHYCVIRPRGSFAPSHYVAYAGSHTTLADATSPYTNAITVTGALATDIPIVLMNTTDDTDNILKAAMSANTLTVTLSANPGTSHKITYMILRAY